MTHTYVRGQCHYHLKHIYSITLPVSLRAGFVTENMCPSVEYVCQLYVQNVSTTTYYFGICSLGFILNQGILYPTLPYFISPPYRHFILNPPIRTVHPYLPANNLGTSSRSLFASPPPPFAATVVLHDIS
jgi:hypothetical protein